MDAVWQVQILFGEDRPLNPDAPMKFGTPQIIVGEDDVTVPLIYGPVALHQYGTSLTVCSAGAPVDVDGVTRIPSQRWRTMELVTSMEFSTWGHVRVEGFEIRDDGSPVRAVWEVEPYSPPADDED